MKRFFFTITILLCAAAAFAQPRSAGLRIGATGLDAVYQHTALNKNEFIEGSIGLDFGVKSNAGFKVSGSYNIILARPALTDKGSWAIYAGPAAALGNVYDMVTYDVFGEKVKYPDNGFMFAVGGQAGIEYNFEGFPIQASIDLRPMVGIHVNDGKFRDPATNTIIEGFESKSGFYGNGFIGFIPHLSVRYRF
ncbi:MAG: hypothetical protein II991_04185 [Bacteroidales bacterium]|nr:hypothetical protein [Bacteroidales bacterium]